MDLFDAASENNTETVSIFSMVLQIRIRVNPLHFRLPGPFQGTGSGPLKA